MMSPYPMLRAPATLGRRLAKREGGPRLAQKQMGSRPRRDQVPVTGAPRRMDQRAPPNIPPRPRTLPRTGSREHRGRKLTPVETSPPRGDPRWADAKAVFAGTGQG